MVHFGGRGTLPASADRGLVCVAGEYSERSLQLSAEVIARNAANYTAWQFRRKCIATMHTASTPEVRPPHAPTCRKLGLILPSRVVRCGTRPGETSSTTAR